LDFQLQKGYSIDFYLEQLSVEHFDFFSFSSFVILHAHIFAPLNKKVENEIQNLVILLLKVGRHFNIDWN